MSLATREQKAVVTDFASAGAFRSFSRQKNMKERLEENTSERLRLKNCYRIQWQAKAKSTVNFY